MCRVDPACPQCGSDIVKIHCKKSRHRWNVTMTCTKCNERRFVLDASLSDAMARLPRPEPMQAALDIPRPRERFEYK
jgi:hypothetical protein